jgi:nicotinate phosphoribosyltransferase
VPWRLYERSTGKAIADVITLQGETIDDSQSYEIFEPNHTWKRKLLQDFVAKPLQIPIFVKGECVYQSPSLQEIQQYCNTQIQTLWDEVLRFDRPHRYYVDLSQDLWEMKQELLEKYCVDCIEKMRKQQAETI